jgi:hypothetical protein
LNHETVQQNDNIDDFSLSGRDGIYHLEWPRLHVEARVDRIREAHDHEVKGEILVVSSRPTSAGHLRQGRIILTSPASRKTMAKSLGERDPDVDWDALLEQLCVATLSEWRTGSPVVQLEQVDVQAQARWLIEPILQLHNPTLIYGPGSTGKSWFAQYLAVLMDEGVSHSGLHVEPSTVLYLDWETDQNELGTRVTMLRHGLGLEGESHIWYKAMNQGLANDIEAIRTVVMDKGIDVVVCDSLGSACMGEPESAEVVLRCFNALRSLGLTSICIDHTNKEGVLFGSVYKYNSARQVFEVKKSQDPDADKLVLGLFHRKANNSKLRRDIGFELAFSADAVTITRRDVRTTELERHLPMLDRIKVALGRGAMAAREITEELETPDKPVSASHVRKELSNGVRKGVISKLAERNAAGDTLYGVPMREPVNEENDRWRI